MLILLSSPALAADNPTQDLLARGDALYAQREEPGKAQAACELYAQAVAAAPQDMDARHKLCRTIFWLADKEEDKDKSLAGFKRGVKEAEAMIRLAPAKAVGYFLRGAFKAMILEATESLSLISQVMDDMHKAVSIDPTIEGGGPWRVLGRLYYKLPGFLGGSNRKALDALQKALAAGPHVLDNHVYLAEVLVREGQREKARQLLTRCLAEAPRPDLAPESKFWKAKARRLLANL